MLRSLRCCKIGNGLAYLFFVGFSVFSVVIYAGTSYDEFQRREDERIKSEQREKINKENEDYREYLEGKKSELKEGEITTITEDRGACFPISKVVFALDHREKLPKKLSFLNKIVHKKALSCIGQGNIFALLGDIAKQIIARGFVTTRLSLPDQDLSSGILRISLHPGYVNKIRSDSQAVSVFIPTVFPFIEGAILNIREIENGLEQIERLSSLDAEFQIFPSPDKPSMSDIVIKIVEKKSPFSFRLGADNAGQDLTGQWTARAGMSYDNPLGIADYWSVNVNSVVAAPNSVSRYGLSSIYELVYGRSTLNANYNYTYLSQPSPGALGDDPLALENIAHNLTLDWSYKGYRNQYFKSDFGVFLKKEWAKSYLGGLELSPSRRHPTEVGLRYHATFFMKRSSLDAEISNFWGVPWLGGMHSIVAPDEPRRDYQIRALDVTYTRPFSLFGLDFNWISSFSGQDSNYILHGAEQFSIGSRYSVRGFGDDFSTSGEEGFYLKNEVSLPVNRLRGSIYAGVDYGKVFGFSTRFNTDNELAGVAIGYKGSIFGVGLDAFASAPLSEQQLDSEGKAVSLNLSRAF